MQRNKWLFCHQVDEDEDEDSDSDESELDDILSQEETVGRGNQGGEGEKVDKTNDGDEEINQIDDDNDEEEDDGNEILFYFAKR